MKRVHILLAAVAVIGLIGYPAAVVVTDHTPAQFKDASEKIESNPGPETPWYATGAMPLFVIGVPLAVGLAVSVWAVQYAGLRRW